MSEENTTINQAGKNMTTERTAIEQELGILYTIQEVLNLCQEFGLPDIVAQVNDKIFQLSKSLEE